MSYDYYAVYCSCFISDGARHLIGKLLRVDSEGAERSSISFPIGFPESAIFRIRKNMQLDLCHMPDDESADPETRHLRGFVNSIADGVSESTGILERLYFILGAAAKYHKLPDYKLIIFPILGETPVLVAGDGHEARPFPVRNWFSA